MFKGVKIFIASILVLLCGSVPASALSVGSLEKVSSDTENIEILAPEQGYYFDANFLAKNQELRYKATIENDEEFPIKIENIVLNNSSYSFLEYSYSGISVDDVINVGEIKEVIISVETNSNNTSTIAEDYNLTLTYSLIKPEPEKPDEQVNPDTAKTTIVKTGTIALISIGAIVFVFVRNKKIRNYVVLFIVTSLGVIALTSSATAEEAASTFSILGKVRFTNIYSVTVDPNEGVYSGELTATRREGEIFHIEEVSREHFEFVEWEINPSNTPDENNDIAIHANTTLKAKWNENTYTLTIKPNGGTYQDSADEWSQSFRPNETATISTPEKEGYDFTHWTVEQGNVGQDGNFSGDSVSMTEDITLVANYEIKKFSVRIDPNGGTYNGETSPYVNNEVEWGTEISLADTAREWYHLVDWTWNESKTKPASTQTITIYENTTLVANWEQIHYTLTINPNGGLYDGSTDIQAESYPVNTEVSILAPERETYRFTGWTIEPTTELSDGKITMTQDYTLTANWEEVYYTLTINPNTGSYEGSTEAKVQSIRAGQSASINDPQKEGYDFVDWSVEEGTIGQDGHFSGDSVVMTEDVTLVANYTIKRFTLTIKPNGGSYDGNTGTYTETVDWNTNVSILDPEKEGYRFTNWTVEQGAIGQDGHFAGNSVTMTENITLVANYEIRQFTLTIKPNGGTYNGSEDIYTNTVDWNTNLSILNPEKEGHDFVDWVVELGNIGQNGHFSGNSVTMTEDITLVANYEILRFTVTIIPNGGTYGGNLTTTVDWNTDYYIQSISRSGYDLKEWTKTIGSNSEMLALDTESINIKANTILEANWWSSTFYTVTIDPNGGVYDGKSEPSEYQVREGTNYTMLEATKDGSLFGYWHRTGTDTRMDEDEFTVTENVSLTAEWVPIVAQIIRNGEFYKYYPSIMAAHEEAISGDTIELLVDTEEIVTNSKNITLDLGTHTVTGYLVNTVDGNLRLINGEFNNYTNSIKDATNPDGAAAINNGTLTLGYDDYTDGDNYNKAPLIDNDYIRLVGSDRGLVQNNIFYFYDGHIDGTIGLVGGYDGSPWYRDTDSPEHEDTDTVYYYPFVSRMVRDEAEFQRVQLANSNRAVSRTIDHGAIYYYELQDNINSSAVTGYQIYAVRNFDNSAPITIDENDEIVFDTDGHRVDFGDTITNNGTFTIKDGKTGDNKGSATLSKSITNNGDLTFQDVTVTGITANTMINGSNRLELKNARLESATATIYNVKNSNETLVMDENSIIESTSAYSALTLDSDFELDGGHIKALSCPVVVKSNKTFTFSNGKIEAIGSAEYRSENGSNGANEFGSIGICNSGKVIINGGNIAVANSASNAYGVKGGNVEMTDGRIEATAHGTANGFNGSSIVMSGGKIESSGSSSVYGIYSSAINITDGEISATATGSGWATGIYSSNDSSNPINGENVKISATTESGDAIGISSYRNMTLTAGTVTATSTDGEADGYRAGHDYANFKINGDNAKILAKSTNSKAYGIATRNESGWGSYYTYLDLTMSAGEVKAITENSNSVAVGASARNATITGGTIEGTTYGFGHIIYKTYFTLNIGTNADPLYNGKVDPDTGEAHEAKPIISGGVYGIYTTITNLDNITINFYDGLISGGTAYIGSEEWIKATPDGAHRVIETSETKQDCWLEYETPYLHVEGYSEKDFRSLGDAYNVVQDGGKITVIEDRETQAVLPSNTKDITLDLNGHTLVYSQPLINDGTLRIEDGRSGGSITNTNSNVVDNNGALVVAGGTLNGGECTIKNEAGKTFELSGGEITSTLKAVCHETKSNTPYATTTMSGGKITVNGNSTNNYAYGIVGYGNFVMTGGEIDATGIGYVTSVEAAYVNITGGAIKATATGSNGATGVYARGDYSNIINGESVNISATTESGLSVALESYNTLTFTAGTATATSVDGEADGYYAGYYNSNTRLIMNGDSAKLIAKSKNNNAYGFASMYSSGYYSASHSGGYLTMSAGTITAETESESKIAMGANAMSAVITGGTITGTTYGAGNVKNPGNIDYTIGTNDNTLYNGQVDPDTGNTNPAKPIISGGAYGFYTNRDTGSSIMRFYDGVISGGTAYIGNEDWIKAIPDGAHKVITTSETKQDCWLEYDTPYLHVEGYNEKDFRSLGDAFNAVQDGGKITVIADRTTQAVLPSNSKNITIDLNGHELNYTQPLVNNSTLKIEDGLGGGKITNTNTTVLDNSGTLEVAGGIIDGAECPVKNRAGKTFTLSGGEIKSTLRAICQEGEYNVPNATTTISGGKVSTDGNSTGNYAYGFTGVGNFVMTGGEIDSTGIGTVYGVSASYINITGGKITATASGTYNATAIDVSGNDSNPINGASVSILATTESGTAAALESRYNITFTAGTVTATSTDGVAQGYSAGDHYDYTRLIMNGDSAKLIAKSKNNNAYGFSSTYFPGYYSASYTGGNLTMSAGQIIAETESESKIAMGANAKQATITGGTITGTTYGAGNAKDPMDINYTIGTNDSTLYNGQDNPANPVISGGVYGLYVKESQGFGNVKFYDGQLIGGTEAIYDLRDIKDIATDTNIYDTTIDGKNVKYLVPGEYIAKINDADCTAENPQCYITIQEAIEASSEGDTITLLDDHYAHYNIAPPEGKKFTLDLAGHELVIVNKISNKSDMAIVSSGAPVTLVYREKDEFITNEANAKLTIDNVNIKTKYPIDAKSGSTTIIKNSAIGYDIAQRAIETRGNLTLENTTVTATDSAVYLNGGAVDISDSDLTGKYAVYNYGSTGIIEDTSLTGTTYSVYQNDANGDIEMTRVTTDGLIYNKSGRMVFDDSDISYENEDWSVDALVTNEDTMIIRNKSTIRDKSGAVTNSSYSETLLWSSKDLTVDDVKLYRENKADKSAYGIVNAGTGITRVSNSEVNISDVVSAYALYDANGTITSENTTYNISNSMTGYGVYVANSSANTTMLSGTINNTANTAYGAWIKDGALTLGEAEPLSSPNRGTANANVSTTSPLIKATGSTAGYAVTLESGTFNYYDGKLVQNEQGFPAYKANHTDKATITNTEYWYEPESAQDGDGNYYYILTYMPQ